VLFEENSIFLSVLSSNQRQHTWIDPREIWSAQEGKLENQFLRLNALRGVEIFVYHDQP
jgi:hypothetical protein